MERLISVAIDGPSGAGKSTIAKALAKKYGFIYVDTGAIYRTVGLAAKRSGIECKDTENISKLLPKISVELKYNDEGMQCMYLNDEDVSSLIRTPEISIAASDVSSLPVVRDYLMDIQRSMATKSSVIMDGRDIGTVVLPNADLKVFLTASVEERAYRRYKELIEKKVRTTYEEVISDMEKRDAQDSNRAAAPLKQADDAILVDTTGKTLEQSIELVGNLIEGKINE